MQVSQEKSDALLEELYKHFPDAQILYKDEDWHKVHWMLWVVWLFATIIGVFSRWAKKLRKSERMSFDERWKKHISNGVLHYIVLPSRKTHGNLRDYRTHQIVRHEYMHLRDQKKHPVWFPFSYFVVLPTGWTMREHWEIRGYSQNMLVEYEVTGEVSDQTLERIAKTLSGPLYFWANPFYSRLLRKLSGIRDAIYDGEISGFYW